MPFSLQLSPQLTRARWKVKIFDKENREPPHVTIIRGRDKWRINLRTRAFMDRFPPERMVDDEVIQAIDDNWELFREQWDQIHPDNPVEGTDDDDA
jgi:hypothetical protein